METLEDKKFIDSSDFTAELVLYYGINTLFVVDVAAMLIWIATWYLGGQEMYINWMLILYCLVSGLFLWAFVILLLKMTNLLRHIYNRLADLTTPEEDGSN